MALRQNDLVRAVARLNELTRSRDIKWTQASSLPPPRGGGIGFSPRLKPIRSFQAIHQSRVLGITQYEVEGAFGLGSPYKYILNVTDKDGSASFEFPDVEGISDLFSSAQRQKLDIESFINDLAQS